MNMIPADKPDLEEGLDVIKSLDTAKEFLGVLGVAVDACPMRSAVSYMVAVYTHHMMPSLCRNLNWKERGIESWNWVGI